jgi:hypothetical protein
VKKWLLSLIASTVFLSLVACTILTGGSNSSKSVEVYLTDTVLPIDQVESVLVTIDRILLVSDDATAVVSDEGTTVKLLELVGEEL